MILATCSHETRHKHGKDRHGCQRFKCALCGQTFVDDVRPLADMRTSVDKVAQAFALMLEGMSVRSVQRMTGLCRETLANLVVRIGAGCQRLLDEKIQSVPVTDVQCDEIWSFVGMKERTRAAGLRSEEFGDSWTFIGIERETKLVLAHKVGRRDNGTCCEFLQKLRKATSGTFQLTSDGHNMYSLNVPFLLGSRVDFAQLMKVYQNTPSGSRRYSPAKIISAQKQSVFGAPDMDRVSTSHVERFNLTLRMSLRRFTRLTNGHSKSRKHHEAMQAIFVCWYNFGRKHEALKGRTPAMASGLADKAWTVKELIENAAAA